MAWTRPPICKGNETHGTPQRTASQARAIGLDTSVFIYHLEAHPRYLPLTQEVLAYGLPFQASSFSVRECCAAGVFWYTKNAT
jgi:hypothetical protein